MSNTSTALTRAAIARTRGVSQPGFAGSAVGKRALAGPFSQANARSLSQQSVRALSLEQALASVTGSKRVLLLVSNSKTERCLQLGRVGSRPHTS